ncbi:hypothetical protein [Campylobacter geochelonis]|uniref:Uncharacterized protein n=1 Tax=Campylobacter geochelonis TaxID=1780362 RepID=A0A128ELR1_9BACT|nr:hypothetical protein [Campylobacter geochelonis]QKF71077.1 hypothetical protein CGEO_0757 [Campylobacter geochelonis]CZE47264.1 Uncharacterised protein [Campylobacter geochelonis]CZE48416.1 Uncharacterised protein [Campylobacter geochelonis]CZE50107.1 Uncharacterised protein [Campylobacter geochelonis]
MILLWIIALLLAIPTYGLSLVVVFIIGAFMMKSNDDNAINRLKNYMKYDKRLCDHLRDGLESAGYIVNISEYEFEDLTAIVLFEVNTKLDSCSDDFKFQAMFAIVAKAMVYYEYCTLEEARRKTEVFIFNFFKNAEKEGIYISW